MCSRCKKKLEKGEITKLDLEIGRLLMSMEEEHPPLQNVYFHKSIESGDILAIFVGQGDIAKILSYGGKIIKSLEQSTKKTVRVLETNSDERKFLEDLFAPMTVLTVNKIWLPDGSTETRVILKGSEKRWSPKYVNALKELAKKARNLTLRIEFAS